MRRRVRAEHLRGLNVGPRCLLDDSGAHDPNVGGAEQHDQECDDAPVPAAEDTADDNGGQQHG